LVLIYYQLDNRHLLV